jgi:hypothetical protein
VDGGFVGSLRGAVRFYNITGAFVQRVQGHDLAIGAKPSRYSKLSSALGADGRAARGVVGQQQLVAVAHRLGGEAAEARHCIVGDRALLRREAVRPGHSGESLDGLGEPSGRHNHRLD